MHQFIHLFSPFFTLQASSSSSSSHERRYFGWPHRPSLRPSYLYYSNAYYQLPYYSDAYQLPYFSASEGLCQYFGQMWPHNMFICIPPQPAVPVQTATAASAQTAMTVPAQTTTTAPAQTTTAVPSQTTTTAPAAASVSPVPRGDN